MTYLFLTMMLIAVFFVIGVLLGWVAGLQSMVWLMRQKGFTEDEIERLRK